MATRRRVWFFCFKANWDDPKAPPKKTFYCMASWVPEDHLTRSMPSTKHVAGGGLQVKASEMIGPYRW